MDGQGRSYLPADVNGRILDRIAGLEKIVSPKLVEQALAQTGKQTRRACRLSNEVMIWVVLAMGLFTELPSLQSLSSFAENPALAHPARTPTRRRLGCADSSQGSPWHAGSPGRSTMRGVRGSPHR